LSAFWRDLSNAEILRANGIHTLIFAGAILDQCVASTLLDVFHEGFDIVLLGAGFATTSPEFSTKCIQWNCEGGWGFLSRVELYRAVADM
jgi:nicotinamidase-related amidase